MLVIVKLSKSFEQHKHKKHENHQSKSTYNVENRKCLLVRYHIPERTLNAKGTVTGLSDVVSVAGMGLAVVVELGLFVVISIITLYFS